MAYCHQSQKIILKTIKFATTNKKHIYSNESGILQGYKADPDAAFSFVESTCIN